MFVPKMHELIKTDDEALVVMSSLDGYAEVLKAVGPPVLQGEGHLDAILNSVRDVMAYKVRWSNTVVVGAAVAVFVGSLLHIAQVAKVKLITSGKTN